MFRNIIAALIVTTLILTSHSYAYDLKEAVFAASIAYQRDMPLSPTQKEALANAQNICSSITEQSACGEKLSGPCIWISEKCLLDEERFALALKVENVISLGKGVLLLGIASVVASAVCGVAGVGLGIACLGVGQFLVNNAPGTRAHFDKRFLSLRRQAKRLS